MTLNAMQPGVFSLSSRDLFGALPLPVAERLNDQDYRWINRGGVDLMGLNPSAPRSAYGLPRARALYGPLPEQLRNPPSFASRLKSVLATRHKYRVALKTMLAVPTVHHTAICVLVFQLPGKHCYAVTALNFAQHSIEENVDLSAIAACEGRPLSGTRLVDAITGEAAGTLDVPVVWASQQRICISWLPPVGRSCGSFPLNGVKFLKFLRATHAGRLTKPPVSPYYPDSGGTIRRRCI